MASSVRLLAAAALLLCHQVAGQTEELGPNYIGEEGKPPLPETALLNGKVVELDELGDIIYLNRSSANLNCAEGKMQIDVNFKEPFNGIIYANFDRTSPCTWQGDGETSYHVELPLRGCGTKQGPARVFTNNIIMRFHPHLEWAGDEVVTIVCRYPPPIAAPPVAGLPFVAGPPETPLTPLKKIGEADIILIICAILFLALLLLGLGFGYACLKKRRISLIKNVPLETAPPSESSIYSPGSVMPIFDGLKIPRAHAVPIVDDVTSSETLPSDYPSESPSTAHSMIDDVEIIPPPSVGPPQQTLVPAGVPPAGVPNHAYLMTEELLNTTYTDKMVREEVDIHRQPNLMKKQPNPEALHAAEQQLTTMLTTADRRYSESPEPPARADVRHVQAELHTPPRTAPPPTISSEFRVHQPPLPPPPPSEPDTVASQDVIDHTELETLEMPPPPPPPPHKPVLTSQTVDDRILSTITETKVYEDIERRRRAVKEYYERKQQALPPDWDVEIRQYPPPERDFPDTASSHWDDSSVGTEVPPLPGLHAARTAFETTDHHFSSTDQTFMTSTTSRTGVDVTRSATSVAAPPLPPPPQPPSPPALERADGPEEPIRPLRREITPPRRNPPSMDVLIRVLEAPQEFDDRLSVLTDDDRETLRQLITREETFRTMLTEARVYQDFERIRQDERFARVLSAQKWDVIIRVLAPPPLEVTPSEFSETTRAPSEVTDFSDIPEPPPEPRIHRYRKTSNQLQQLPPVYEYETGPGRPPRSGPGSTRSHVTTRSSYGGDVRSMTEEMVSFHRYQPTWSETDTAPRPLSIDPSDGGPLQGATQRTYFESHQEVDLPGGGQRRYFESHQEVSARGAPSTIGDREEVYSMAETDVDWQRR
ncbi:verprolin-like [Amphibalanus amphitrite]|uniref:verprolin-like n=1 Tax=Amphibalanus amphitrite TaxID=1232801 RepID=UPI001C917DCC|nr:verprolin-like [Amphibalanus amphitrite]